MYMRTALIAACSLLVILVVGYLLWPKTPNITNYPPKGLQVVALGDSLTHGEGASEGHDWPTLVGKRLGITIGNEGVNGNTSAQALDRLDRDVLSLHPDIVIVTIGGNDHLQNVPDDTTFANIRTIISKVQATGAVVMLIGVRGRLLNDVWEERFAALAEETGSLYMEDILKGLFGDERYMSDTIHPNDAGYERIADRITPLLGELLGAAQRKTTDQPKAQ